MTRFRVDRGQLISSGFVLAADKRPFIVSPSVNSYSTSNNVVCMHAVFFLSANSKNYAQLTPSIRRRSIKTYFQNGIRRGHFGVAAAGIILSVQSNQFVQSKMQTVQCSPKLETVQLHFYEVL